VTNGATDTTLSWYLRSLGNADTHRGRISPDGTVVALCGARFAPRPTLRVAGQPPDQQLVNGPLALRGTPPDPDQVCEVCRRGGGGAR
jgi:hypothetical protein